jgi:hypothetical protein
MKFQVENDMRLETVSMGQPDQQVRSVRIALRPGLY